VAPFSEPAVGITTCRPVSVNPKHEFIGFAAHPLWDLHHQINLAGSKLERSLLSARFLRESLTVQPPTRPALNRLSGVRGTLPVFVTAATDEFLARQRNATVVITDSGGIQEESTYLGVPCLTLRNNTERPITGSLGTNLLIGNETNCWQRSWRTCLLAKRSGAASRHSGMDTQESGLPTFY
jgi:hypothetical protein